MAQKTRQWLPVCTRSAGRGRSFLTSLKLLSETPSAGRSIPNCSDVTFYAALRLVSNFRPTYQCPVYASKMFILSKMKDTVRIVPWMFEIKQNDAITESLNQKFANKVVHNLGLCIALWDITAIGDSFIFPGDGASHTVVEFRYVVFRPFMDEILIGKIKSSSKDGVYVSVGFFDDILIPADAMQLPSRFDEAEQLWVWGYETEDGKHDLFMDIGEDLRFRVVDEAFVDTTPTGPEAGGDATEITEGEKKSPYSLVATISEPGLGLLSWWNNT